MLDSFVCAKSKLVPELATSIRSTSADEPISYEVLNNFTVTVATAEENKTTMYQVYFLY